MRQLSKGWIRDDNINRQGKGITQVEAKNAGHAAAMFNASIWSRNYVIEKVVYDGRGTDVLSGRVDKFYNIYFRKRRKRKS